ncbi:MAG: hypothetical protein IPM29_15225 [Planctomycetes bacterium]|nr:hypothetical protein [Planctomycetota bacterium]
MRIPHLTVLLLLPATLLLPHGADPAGPRAPATAAVPGPGGVLHAVTAFLAARDARDVDACAALLGAERELVTFARDAAGEFQFATGGATRFFGIRADGTPFTATGAAEFAAAACAADTGGHSLATTVREVCAACTSEEVSRAIIRFERVVRDGERIVARRPMRATAALRYRAGPPAGFEIYHWHESPDAGSPAPPDSGAGR